MGGQRSLGDARGSAQESSARLGSAYPLRLLCVSISLPIVRDTEKLKTAGH